MNKEMPNLRIVINDRLQNYALNKLSLLKHFRPSDTTELLWKNSLHLMGEKIMLNVCLDFICRLDGAVDYCKENELEEIEAEFIDFLNFTNYKEVCNPPGIVWSDSQNEVGQSIDDLGLKLKLFKKPKAVIVSSPGV